MKNPNKLRGFFRGPGWYYVCATWPQCQRTNLMWQAISEDIVGLEPGGWECSCGQPDNIRIHTDQARKESLL